jgi:uncharacterized protein YdaU (DUF1376 family)
MEACIMGFSFMPMYVGDILRNTLHLRAENFGAYHYLIYHYWEHGKLPQSDSELAQIAHLAPRRWKTHKATLQAFFSETWTHDRIDAERAKAAELIEKRRNAANCRWNANASSTSNANEMQGHCTPNGMESTFRVLGDSLLQGKSPKTRRKPLKVGAPPREAPQSRSPAVGAAPATATPRPAIPNGQDEEKPEKQPAEKKPWIPADTQILSAPLNFGEDPFAIRVCEYRDGRPVALHPVKGHLMVWYEAGSDGYERWHQAGWYCGVHRDKTGKSVWPFPYDLPPFEYTRGLAPTGNRKADR